MLFVLYVLAPALQLDQPLRLHYRGGAYGVRAEITLNTRTRVADVSLSGMPLGGELRGAASFGEGGDVVFDEELGKALRRRFVKIVDVVTDERFTTCWVVAELPIVGSTNITLRLVNV